MNRLQISDVKLTTSSLRERNSGLLGWISATLNRSLQIDGITLRRTIDGRHVVSFPFHQGAGGHQQFHLRLVNDAARRDIEHQILSALSLDQEAAQ